MSVARMLRAFGIRIGKDYTDFHTQQELQIGGEKVLTRRQQFVEGVPTGQAASAKANAEAINSVILRLESHGLVHMKPNHPVELLHTSLTDAQSERTNS